MSKCRQLKIEEVIGMTRDGCRPGPNGKRNRALILFGAMVGYRNSELLSLRRCDLLDDDGFLRPEVTVASAEMKRPGGKKAAEQNRKSPGRTVPIPDQAKSIMRAWLVEMERLGWAKPSDFVFINLKTGRPIGRASAWKVVRSSAKRAGIPTGRVGVHSLRKTFAAENYDALLVSAATGEKVDVLRTMQRLLGHQRIESTTYYLATLDNDLLVKTVNSAAARFGKAIAERLSCPTP